MNNPPELQNMFNDSNCSYADCIKACIDYDKTKFKFRVKRIKQMAKYISANLNVITAPHHKEEAIGDFYIACMASALAMLKMDGMSDKELDEWIKNHIIDSADYINNEYSDLIKSILK